VIVWAVGMRARAFSCVRERLAGCGGVEDYLGAIFSVNI